MSSALRLDNEKFKWKVWPKPIVWSCFLLLLTRQFSTQMINNFILAGKSLILQSWGLWDTKLMLLVQKQGYVSTDHKVKGVQKKLSQLVVKSSELKGGRIFFQLLDSGSEKFPHNTTEQQDHQPSPNSLWTDKVKIGTTY